MNSTVSFIGIDFGTSNSKMAWYNPKTNQAEIILNAEGESETPSVVYFGKDQPFVGDSALEMLDYEQERERVILSIKRELVTTPLLALPDRSIKPTEVAAEILRKLKRDAQELHFHQEITCAVITYPASFGPLERDKIREAAQLAGFTEVEMLEEPVAAAIAYAQMGLKVGKSVLVYDLGGGTFDLAVLNYEDDGTFHSALEPQGIKRCGGDDFDEALYNHCNKIAQEKLGRPISLTGKRDLHFLHQCRQRKENLSTAGRRMFKSLLEPGSDLFQYEITRATFESLISVTIEETVRKTKALLEQANTAGQIVDTMVLIGGSSRVPLVQRLLEKSLPLRPLQWQNRDRAVALGAAYHAHGKWGGLGSDKAFTDHYRSVLEDASTGKVDKAKIERFMAQPNKSYLSEHHVVDEQYLKAVVEVWSNKKLEKAKIERLTALAKELALSKEQVAQIEREVMGDTKEVILARQAEPIKQPTQKKPVGSTLCTYRGHSMHVATVAWSPDGRRIASGSNDVQVVWDATTGHKYSTYFRGTDAAAWSPDGTHIASGYSSINVWDVATGQKILDYDVHSRPISALAWSPDGTRIASGDHGESVQVCDAVTGKSILTYQGHTKSIEGVAWSLDGRRIASGSDDETVQIWDAATGRTLYTYRGHSSYVSAVAWSPDGTRIASGSWDCTVQVWDATTGRNVVTYRGHFNWTDYVNTVAWSPDGKRIASGSDDKTVQVWDAATGQTLYTYRGHSELINAVAWSPDGTCIASGSGNTRGDSNDNTVQVWQAP